MFSGAITSHRLETIVSGFAKEEIESKEEQAPSNHAAPFRLPTTGTVPLPSTPYSTLRLLALVYSTLGQRVVNLSHENQEAFRRYRTSAVARSKIMRLTLARSCLCGIAVHSSLIRPCSEPSTPI